MASVMPFAFLLQYQQEKMSSILRQPMCVKKSQQTSEQLRTYDRSNGSRHYPCITHSN